MKAVVKNGLFIYAWCIVIWQGSKQFVLLQKLQPETEKLDTDIRLWSSGKETDIRMLLSTLHRVINVFFFVDLSSLTTYSIPFRWCMQLITGELTRLYVFVWQILWSQSGWSAVPYMSLIESSQVKKAYQKARLCLHPDKLQQRGATLLQKYIAEKAFSILQVCKICTYQIYT